MHATTIKKHIHSPPTNLYETCLKIFIKASDTFGKSLRIENVV